MRLISQGKEINCFKGMGLSGLCSMGDLLSFLIESRALEGERRSIYWCMPAILYSLFSILPSFSFLSFFFLFFLRVLLFFLLGYSPGGCYYNIFCDCDPDVPPYCARQGPFYSAYCDWILLL